MSYILNALRKAEQARQGKQAPNLQSTILHPSQPTESKRGLLLILVLCNVALLLLFVIYLWQSSSPDAPATGSPVATVVPADGGQHQTDVGTSSPGQGTESLAHRAKPGKEGASTIAEMVKQKQARKLSEKAASGAHPPVRQAQGSAQPSSVARSQGGKRQPRHPAPGNGGGAESAQAEELVAAVASLPNPEAPPKTNNDVGMTQPAPATREPTVDPLPLLNELPYSIRRKFPKLNINVYVYSNDPRERFIIVDMVRFREGQKMTDKMVLKEIRPDDFVVSFQGKTFRVPRP